MRRFGALAICFALLSVSAVTAQTRQAATSKLPPLLDRELLFGNPEIANASISPDGKYMAFMKPWKDTMNIWAKSVDQPFSAAKLLTSETKRPVATYLWSRDGKYVLYVKDNDGDENFNVYAVDPAASAAAGAEAPVARDLTGLKGARVMLYSAPRNDPDTAFIGLNDRDKAWHDLYRLKLSTGERTLVRQNTARISAWFFDLQGQLRLAVRIAENGDQEMLRVDPSGFTKVYACDIFESCAPIRFHKDGKRVYIVTNRGDGVDLIMLALLDPQTGKAETVESDPLKHVDLTGAQFSEVTDELTFTVYREDHVRRYFRDKTLEADYKWLEGKLPTKDFAVPSRSMDEQVWLVTANSDTEPGATYLFDRKSRKLTFQYKIRQKLSREALAPMQVIHYKSSDGLEIPAYLTLPKSTAHKDLPLIALPHGGPWGRDIWGYSGLTQFLANRGYAVLMPNFRGSTGYGKKFLNAGNGEWGRKMQDDITWGVQYLTSQHIADPKRVGIMGGSYGGYATLAGIAFTPDLYSAAVELFGPSNLITLLEATPPYWEAERKILFARMADLNTPAGQAWLKERSPLNSAGDIKTPLLVVQGANDVRVNKAESEQIVIALRDHGLPVEYLLIPDEGHGFARPVNNMAAYMAAEKFLGEHLDARHQEGGTPEVVARLKEITVDPKAVVLSKRVDAAAVSVPKPAVDLKPDTLKYRATVMQGPQQISLNLSIAIEEENGNTWSVTQSTETPAGTATDTALLEKGTLILRKRTLHQGPATINVDINGTKATGILDIGGREIPLSIELGGPIFADGPGATPSIASLPLAEGYTTTFRNIDAQRQKTTFMRLNVAGSESVTVPAGTFNAFRVELTSDDAPIKVTCWVAKDTRKTVKASIASGPANTTLELVP